MYILCEICRRLRRRLRRQHLLPLIVTCRSVGRIALYTIYHLNHLITNHVWSSSLINVYCAMWGSGIRGNIMEYSSCVCIFNVRFYNIFVLGFADACHIVRKELSDSAVLYHEQ
ncbi:hypothetical protein BLOT_015470 [Blomia tropicalis]|nr:hypothetical protein BLOT_015470 [Blomia tropicalis]